MRVFHLTDRNVFVRGITTDGVLYDTIFPQSKENARDRLERTTFNVPDTVQRTPSRYRYMSLPNFVTMLAQAGHYLRSDNATVQAEIDAIITSYTTAVQEYLR